MQDDQLWDVALHADLDGFLASFYQTLVMDAMVGDTEARRFIYSDLLEYSLRYFCYDVDATNLVSRFRKSFERWAQSYTYRTTELEEAVTMSVKEELELVLEIADKIERLQPESRVYLMALLEAGKTIKPPMPTTQAGTMMVGKKRGRPRKQPMDGPRVDNVPMLKRRGRPRKITTDANGYPVTTQDLEEAAA